MLERRLAAQLLAGPPATSTVAVAERLLAVQAQDPRGARLAIRARTAGLTVADVDRALTDERSLLITWLNRGTLHLVCATDYPWLHAVTTPQLRAGNARRLAQEGVAPSAADRAVTVIERSLTEEGPLTRQQLRARIDAAGVRTEGQALVHLLLLASIRGLMVRGPMVGADQAYGLVCDWLPRPRVVDRAAALAELARRYLAGHGPAADRHLARWAGLPLRDARAGLSAIAGELTQLPGGLLDVSRGEDCDGLPPPRLLGQFDPVLLGWVSRDPIVGAHRVVVTVNGLFRPFAMVRGRAVALWSLAGGRIDIKPFAPVRRSDVAALEADAADVRRFLLVARARRAG